MSPICRIPDKVKFVAALALIVGVPLCGAEARDPHVLHHFAGAPNDGANPVTDLLIDRANNLYGVTPYGGIVPGCAGGCGTVFEVAPDGTESVLYEFSGGNDGAEPWCILIMDKAGNLYGTTRGGGTAGKGSVFKLAPTGTETVLYSFSGGADGAYPYAGLTWGKGGYLYGTTARGGARDEGTVFELSPDGVETVIHSFHFDSLQGDPDGSGPQATLLRDSDTGDLYGTTFFGGGGLGTVFRVKKNGDETILHAFGGGSDGAYPSAGLIMDSGGNLYGTASGSGSGNFGSVYKIAPNGTFTVLYSGFGGVAGYAPYGGLVRDANGNLYGTTVVGGAKDHGTVFELSPDGVETVLYSFGGRKRGGMPEAGLVMDRSGTLYGTTSLGGGADFGTVFKLKR